jgi:protein ImuB
MRRVACIALTGARLEIARDRGAPLSADEAPVAIVIARSGGTVKTERDVLGGSRLDVVSPRARALGVRARQTVAAARAKCAGLCVRVVAEEAVRSALERVAEAVQPYGTAVAFDAREDVVWIEISGCAHLFGGESELARAIHAKVAGLGHANRVAIADGPRIAAAVARFVSGQKPGPLVVPAGQGARAMRVLPLAALPLDEDTIAWLRDLGMRSGGDLQKLPRRALGTRLGARAHEVIALLDGDDRAPLAAWRPPEVPEERLDLEWGASSVEALAFVVKTLSDRLAARLEGRAMGAVRLELELGLDRALCEGDARLGIVTPKATLVVTLPAPIARATDLLAVMRARLDRETLEAPVLKAKLRAPELARMSSRPLDLLAPEPKVDLALPRLVAELTADLGDDRVGTLGLVDTWAPDERTRLVPFGDRPDSTGEFTNAFTNPSSGTPPPPREPGYRYSLVTSALEPSRLVRPTRIADAPKIPLEDIELFTRIESIGWWRLREKSAAPPVIDRPRTSPSADWIAAWFHDAHAWVEVVSEESRKEGRLDDAWLRGWID